MKKIFMFPGQGSQTLGMGDSLFEEFPNETTLASDILGYCIKELCLKDKDNQLNQTQFTQPALYVVNALSLLRLQSQGTYPELVLGHSLGEYNALLAANVFDFETGLKLVQKRGLLMSQCSGGGMLAIIGMSWNQIKEVLKKNDLEKIDLANHNGPHQVIISGPTSLIDQAIPVFQKEGAKKTISLPVSGAFHSRYMVSIQDKFSTFLDTASFKDPSLPVISNVTAKPYTFSTIKTNLSEQIVQPVRWVESLEYILKQEDLSCVEVGPGKVLTGLFNRFKKTYSS
ncbi:[acyl-carrier-protein] S-malonyltransferase [PVC group bacterium (ex Bugula neritina AB1)]|nr:[acyl-carrier-protein] S-malonyltransferase [PVC group bacterium (ex Bugula neritina AB1)]